MSIGFTAQGHLKDAILAVLVLVFGLGACDTGMDAAARAEHHLAAGVEALQAGEFDRAWPLCDAAWRLRPEVSGALRCAALAGVGWGRWDLAVQALHAMLEQSPSQEEDPWVWITLWLARVRSGDRAGAARVVEDLGDGAAAAEIRRGILALALAEGVDLPEWGFLRDQVETWGGVLPLIWAARNLPADAMPRKPDDREAAGYLALRAALDGMNLEAEAGPSPSPEISGLLAAAAGGQVSDDFLETTETPDPSVLLLRRFLGSDHHGCAFHAGLPAAPRIQAAAAHLEAICLERRGETNAALARYHEAVALAPWHRTIRLNRALLLARIGSFHAARVELEHLSVEVPGHPILKVLEGLLAGADGDTARSAAVRARVEDLAPAYRVWMDEVLAE